MAQKVGLQWSLDTMVNESLVTRARNNLMAKMMTNDKATHFMFIDADIRFQPDSIFQRLATDKDVIGGLYPKKALPISYVINVAPGKQIINDLFKVDTMGTGFMQFKRHVYEKLIAAHPETKYVDDVGLGKQFEPFMYSIFDTVIDEKGQPVTPSAIAAIVSLSEIARAKAKGETNISVLHNLLTSKAVAEFIKGAGATPVRTRVGHSLIKDEMAKTGAIFGGEHSAHYYFKDFYGADSGMLAAMHVLRELGSQSKPLSEFAAEFDPYFASGEINSTVSNAPEKLAQIRNEYQGQPLDELDGITISSETGVSPWWWFNVRSSNTEPLLRLNVESSDPGSAKALTDKLLGIIRS
jgi:hypothetical protein